MMQYALLLYVCVFATAVADSSDGNVITKNGPVTGTSQKVDGRQVWEFLGLPFADPPVASLRFVAPQPLTRTWTEHLVANKPPHGCLQMPMSLATWPEKYRTQYVEDCLYLNIWSPTLEPGSKKSVMVWLHGGAFTSGESLPYYNGKALSAIGDVVVVVVQYRVGILGFARFDSKLVPGNAGLLDQQLGLKWIHDNIAQFGGDPNSVTIFGESAGSGSVAHHMLNEESGKYFNRAIMQSGAIGPNLWSFNPNVDAMEAMNREIMDQYLHCDQTSTTELLKCLEGKSEEEMRTMILKYAAEHPNGPHNNPTIDGKFITHDLFESIERGEINKKDLIIGLNEREGDFLLNFIIQMMSTVTKLPDPIESIITPDFARQLLPNIIPYYPFYPHKLSPAAFEMIIQRSYSHADPTNPSLNAVRLSETIGQFCIECAVNIFADAVRRIHSNVYFYQLTHVPSHPILPVIPFKWMKSSHGDDVQYVFGYSLVYPGIRNMTDEELIFSRRMMADWSNFARTGHPLDPNWKPFTLQKKEFYKYGVKSSMETGGVKRDDCVFWNKVLPMINGLWCEKDSEANCNLSDPRKPKPDRKARDEL